MDWRLFAAGIFGSAVFDHMVLRLGITRADTAQEMEAECPVAKLKRKASSEDCSASCSDYSYGAPILHRTMCTQPSRILMSSLCCMMPILHPHVQLHFFFQLQQLSSPKHGCAHKSIHRAVMAGGADIEEGLGEDFQHQEPPRPIRWNQPAVVIISCCIILGVLGSGIGYAIR